MSGTVFVDAGAALADVPASPDVAGVADAVVGVALMLAAGVAAVAALAPVVPVAPEPDVPELAGAPVPVEVPDGVHAAATDTRKGSPNERKVVMTRAWDDTTEGAVKEEPANAIDGRRSVVTLRGHLPAAFTSASARHP